MVSFVADPQRLWGCGSQTDRQFPRALTPRPDVYLSCMDRMLALNRLHPEDLFPVWCRVDEQERAGRIDAAEARRWKHGIYELMVRWAVEPGDLEKPSCS